MMLCFSRSRNASDNCHYWPYRGAICFQVKYLRFLYPWDLGIIYALVLGEASFDLTGVGQATLPVFAVKNIVEGFKLIIPYLSVIIPIEIYNFIETMDNVRAYSCRG